MADDPPSDCPECDGTGTKITVRYSMFGDPPERDVEPCPRCSVEPPSISELEAATEVAWRDLLVAQSQALQPDGCCSTDTWRGHLCPYHEGYADGIDETIERLKAIDRMINGL